MLRQKDIFQLPEFWNYAWLKVIVLPKGSNLNEERSIFVCQQNCQNIFFSKNITISFIPHFFSSNIWTRILELCMRESNRAAKKFKSQWRKKNICVCQNKFIRIYFSKNNNFIHTTKKIFPTFDNIFYVYLVIGKICKKFHTHDWEQTTTGQNHPVEWAGFARLLLRLHKVTISLW